MYGLATCFGLAVAGTASNSGINKGKLKPVITQDD